MQLNQIIGTIVLVVVIAVPVGAALSVYRENLEPQVAWLKRLLAFDPRHAGLGFDRRS